MNHFVLPLLGVLAFGENPDAAVPLLAPPPPKAVETLRGPAVPGGYSLLVFGQGYLYQGPGFDARVAADGTVSFRDKHGSARLLPFTPAWGLDLRAGPSSSPMRPGGQRHLPPHAPEQVELCPPSSSCWTPIPGDENLINVTGNYGMTDAMDDPYAAEKARFLSATFDLRMKLATDSRRDLLKQTLDFFPQSLEALWDDGRYSPGERRRILYELWYESAGTPAGGRAAEMILLFVRHRLPCGSPDGYTTAELQTFRTAHPDRKFGPVGCERR